MGSEEKEISYTITNSYSTLNTLTKATKNVWFVCHGMGYLSRYFLNYFQNLNPNENYIIAPQAQSKYYIPPKFQYVGASWLTKENTIKETENVMRYFDAVFEAEAIPKDKNLIVFGSRRFCLYDQFNTNVHSYKLHIPIFLILYWRRDQTWSSSLNLLRNIFFG